MSKSLIVTSKVDGAFWIRMNRPAKKNAVTFEMYNSIIKGLHASEEDPEVAVTVITGTGDYFSSGNDFSAVMNDPATEFVVVAEIHKPNMPENPEIPPLMPYFSENGLIMFSDSSRSSLRTNPFEQFVYELIDHKKPLIAVVNGPAVGFTVTILGLMDYVIATSRATFLTPFSQLGVIPEGCSTFTFPMMMGYSKACHMLLFGEKVTADWALQANLVSVVIPDEQFDSTARGIVQKFAKLPKETLVTSKRLLKEKLRDRLNATNKRENEELQKKYASEETMQLLFAKFAKSKM